MLVYRRMETRYVPNMDLSLLENPITHEPIQPLQPTQAMVKSPEILNSTGNSS